MKRFTKRITLTLALLAVGATGMIAYQSVAAGRLAGRPTVVVTVRLKSVIENLDQFADNQASLSKLNDEMKTEKDKRTAEIKPLEDQLKAMEKEPDSPQKRELQEKYAKTVLNFQAWQRVTKTKADIELALLLQNLYKTVKAEVRNMASAEGYDIVLVDDSQGELSMDPDSRASRETQVMQQIAARRMLYANPDLDITNDLITRMNNAFHAGTPATGAGKAGDAPATPGKPGDKPAAPTTPAPPGKSGKSATNPPKK